MNELYHVHGFKYVKREWKNGKWNYYYDNGKGKSTSLGIVNKISDWIGEDEKERYRQASARAALDRKNSENATNALRSATDRRDRSHEAYTNAKDSYASNHSASNSYNKRYAEYQYAKDSARVTANRNSAKAAGNRDRWSGVGTYNAKNEYARTPLGIVEQLIGSSKKSSSGINSVAHKYGTIKVVDFKHNNDTAERLLKQYRGIQLSDIINQIMRTGSGR